MKEDHRDPSSGPCWARSDGRSSFAYPLTVNDPVLPIATADEQDKVKSLTAVEDVSFAVIPGVESVVSRSGDEAVPPFAVGEEIASSAAIQHVMPVVAAKAVGPCSAARGHRHPMRIGCLGAQ